MSVNENDESLLGSFRAFEKLGENTAESQQNLKRKSVNTRNKCGRRSSLLPSEESFLALLQEHEQKEFRDDPSDNVSSSMLKPINRLHSAVDAVTTREKLRQSLMEKILLLSGPEESFLTNLVNNENTTCTQLLQADKVLQTDPLYCTKVEEEESGKEATKEKEIDPLENDTENNITKKEMISKIRGYSISHKRKAGDHHESKEDDIEVEFRQSCQYAFVLDEIEKELYGVDLSQPSKYSRSSWRMLEKQPSEYLILGTSPDDKTVKPHVLSPAIMESLRSFLPRAVSDDNFWLKYSMNRDGASLQTMYNQVRNTTRSILAIETTMGEVFGAYVSSPWRNNVNFYGSCESFVWRLKSSRFMPTSSIEEQVKLESSLDVFSWSKENRNIQLSTNSRLIIGGGKSDTSLETGDDDKWGMCISLNDDLFIGTSSPCLTFRSPSLTNQDDGVFEISNIEIWTLSPCFDIEKAEQLELGRMFVLSHY